MEALADRGNGNYAHIDSLAEARKVLVEQAGGTLVPVADDLKIQIEFNPEVVTRYRLVGYDNRRLAHKDFADDRKDAGEVGSGHTMTALYELELDDDAQPNHRWFDLRMRYKNPGEKRSRLIEARAYSEDIALDNTSDDFRFVAAVAGFAGLLKDGSSGMNTQSWQKVYDLALDARGDDPRCQRAGLLTLIRQAARLRGSPLEPATDPSVEACHPVATRQHSTPPNHPRIASNTSEPSAQAPSFDGTQIGVRAHPRQSASSSSIAARVLEGLAQLLTGLADLLRSIPQWWTSLTAFVSLAWLVALRPWRARTNTTGRRLPKSQSSSGRRRGIKRPTTQAHT